MKKMIIILASCLFICSGNLFAQNIGIGTTTPAYPLTLQREGGGFVQTGNTVEFGTAVSGTAGYLKTFTNHPIYFGTGDNGVQMALTYTGRLGVGTISPTVKMEIAHNQFDLLQLTNTTALGSGKNVVMTFKTGSAFTGSIGTYGLTATESRMGFATGALLNERLTIKSNGYIGINNTNPSNLLDVNGDVKVRGDLDVDGTTIMKEISYSLCFQYNISSNEIAATGKKVVLDDIRLNNKSGLIVFATRYENASTSIPVRAIYDDALGKWCLYTNGYHQTGITTFSYSNCQDNCTSITIPTFSECKFTTGETYNILAFY